MDYHYQTCMKSISRVIGIIWIFDAKSMHMSDTIGIWRGNKN
jgi:hypothetical protein